MKDKETTGKIPTRNSNSDAEYSNTLVIRCTDEEMKNIRDVMRTKRCKKSEAVRYMIARSTKPSDTSTSSPTMASAVASLFYPQFKKTVDLLEKYINRLETIDKLKKDVLREDAEYIDFFRRMSESVMNVADAVVATGNRILRELNLDCPPIEAPKKPRVGLLTKKEYEEITYYNMLKITLVGNLTADAKTVISRDGVEMMVMTLAVNTVRSGEKKTTYFSINKRKTDVLAYLKKGRQLCVVGDIDISQEVNDGQPKVSLKVYADSLTLGNEGKS